MLSRYGDREALASRREESCAFLSEPGVVETAIRYGSRTFHVPPGLVAELRSTIREGLNRRERRALVLVEQLEERLRLQGENVASAPAQLNGYVKIVQAEQARHDAALSQSGSVPARTIPGRIVQLKREAGPLLPNAIKLVIHATAAGFVVLIEVVLFHSALGIAFEPMLGTPTQTISNGILALVCLTAIIAGAFAFQDASEGTKRLIPRVSRIAVVCFLAGSCLFVANTIFSSLHESASAAGFDVSDTGSLGFLGSIGLSAIFGSGSILAWVASHHSLNRIKVLFEQVMSAASKRQEAARMERDRLEAFSELANARSELDEIRDEIANLDLRTAERTSALCAPAVLAGHALLTQLDLYGRSNSNLIPDELTEEALSYDRDVLRKKLTRFDEETRPAAILSQLQKTRPGRKGK